MLNLYCAYYVMDDENYAWRRESRNDVATYVGSEGFGGILRAFDISGMASMYSNEH